MAFSWTKEQLQVISLRGRNILVSAAAGSGKTAVLVERIIGLITDEAAPVDIDQLLIVTFTNAAAAEMRERIGSAIEKKVGEQPDNVHLLRQLTLVHHAQITTIHSFCLNVIRNYFHKIDLDPSFRIGDEGELKLLKEEVLGTLLEQHYEEAKEEFTSFVDTFAQGKDDTGIGELILKCYEFSCSYPWPEEWLAACREAYAIETVQELEKTEWMGFLTEQLALELEEQQYNYQRMVQICEDEDGPAYLLPVIAREAEMVEGTLPFSSFTEGQGALQSIAFERLPRKKKTDVFDEDKLKQVKALRDGVKKNIAKLQKTYGINTEQVLEQLKEAAPAVSLIIGLAEEFATAYAEAKKSRNLVDFNDLEHFALKILTVRENGQWKPSDVAMQYRDTFAEIMIDEYQDSNLVQEVVLNAISKEPLGQPNLFMVGDVKQSIYKFRLARPELFMEKYHTYTTEDSLYQKIELHQNFRSRASVLHSVNYLFYRMMQASLGGIDYTEDAALHPALTFAEGEGCIGGSTELLLLDLSQRATEDADIEGADAETVSGAGVKEQGGVSETRQLERDSASYAAASAGIDTSSVQKDSLEEEERSSRTWEARLVGERILQLVNSENPQMVWDKEQQCYRPASFRDIVILLRSLSGWAEEFVKTLMDMGIPAYAESRSGYFTTIEVQTVLNLLHIIDNPIQDIPLVAVLHSPLVGLTSQELSRIRQFAPRDIGSGFYGALLFYREHGGDGEELFAKVQAFLEDLSRYRDMAGYLPLHSLLEQILEQTGYYAYVSLMPGGERRRANIDMLLQKALAYESTSYKGVFHFIRYIELLQKYAVDFGEASVTGEQDDTVRIMSIHKSKGLEFPIVILAGCAKKFNVQDTRARVVFHPDYGMGVDAVNPALRTREVTLLKRAFAGKLQLENLGEELRVLYVALTRAREKLILTGACKELGDYLKKISLSARETKGAVRYGVLSKAASYLDFMLPALAQGTELYDFDCEASVSQTGVADTSGEQLFAITCTDCYELAEKRQETVKEEALQMQEFEQWDSGQVWEPEWAQELEERFAYSYHYDRLYQVHATMSVSELKRLSQVQDDVPPVAELYPQKKQELFFLQAEQEGEEIQISQQSGQKQEEMTVSGARRGTLYHLVMENLKYESQMTRETIEKALDTMVEKGILTPPERTLIFPGKILPFFRTPLYRRLYAAWEKNKLHRERQFIIGIPVEELTVHQELAAGAANLPLTDSVRSGGDFVMVQGIIDLYFEEEDGLVLLDYKTDRVRDEETLTSRYCVQLDYYQKALERLTGKPVKERYLYAFALNCLIRI